MENAEANRSNRNITTLSIGSASFSLQRLLFEISSISLSLTPIISSFADQTFSRGLPFPSTMSIQLNPHRFLDYLNVTCFVSKVTLSLCNRQLKRLLACGMNTTSVQTFVFEIPVVKHIVDLSSFHHFSLRWFDLIQLCNQIEFNLESGKFL